MAVFHSKYRELSFYVAGVKHSFSSGSFSTDDDEIIAVLDTMLDVKRIDEEVNVVVSEEKPTTRRKASAK
ncbi:hypothetical protein [Paenibacillus terrigena]|uniref:hypothetical protein n=1 Tax=Paenibacillus terrigena TaxID=369333 RepID=UPI00036D69E1|nr:hypothetical protein [Paenibacillus terrigena]